MIKQSGSAIMAYPVLYQWFPPAQSSTIHNNTISCQGSKVVYPSHWLQFEAFSVNDSPEFVILTRDQYKKRDDDMDLSVLITGWTRVPYKQTAIDRDDVPWLVFNLWRKIFATNPRKEYGLVRVVWTVIFARVMLSKALPLCLRPFWVRRRCIFMILMGGKCLNIPYGKGGLKVRYHSRWFGYSWFVSGKGILRSMIHALIRRPATTMMTCEVSRFGFSLVNPVHPRALKTWFAGIF